ncbi:hypothetical protein [Roseomonas fluvialis]|uniref:Lipoprotein n=1 Tax=Roseomonas fluvialis TaxID=1750527 RepID=A0ABM7Y5I4_9PROT|nr:hypothetical protein [Roseomonas fluvialis]BDG73200.1 hypothetical protein Rmf_31290 [Roseomonas fluvialis]
MARHIPAALGLVLALGACGSDNYFPAQDIDRRGTWQAEGINDRNLRLQVADPAHLTRGAGAATDRGDQASRAINAFNAGRRPPLPTGISDVGTQGGGGAGVSSGGGGGGGGN